MYAKGSDPANGTVIVNADGTYTYTPNANFNGTDSFTYTVSDGAATQTYTITVTVAPVNDAPVGRNDAVSTSEDVTFNGQLPTASDPDGDALTYGLGTQAGNGTVTVNPDGSYSYVPNANFNGMDSFTYTVSDGTTTVSYAVTVTVGAVNDPPVGSDGTASTNEDTPINGQLPAATDADGDALIYAKGSDPANGNVTVNASGSYTYTPNANFNGTDTFTYTVTDGTATRTYTVTVTVGGENDPPVGANLDVTIDEDGRAQGQLPQATDPDGDALTYGLGTQAGNGTATVNADGSYSYVPNANFNGTDTFTYTVDDGTTIVSYTVTIIVNPVQDAPVGSDGAITTNEDTAFNGRLPVATDADGDTLVYGLGSQASNGAVVINADGTYRYVPAANFSGTDSFTYTVSDGTTTVAYTIAITVVPVNDAPVGENAAITTPEDTVTTGRLPVATDADGDTLTYGLGAAATHGTVVVNADGTYSYTPNRNFNGTDSFTYTVSDGTATSTYTVTVTVTPVNDAPIGSDTAISATSGSTTTGSLPSATDPEGSPVTYGLGTQAQHGTVTINADGSYSYTPVAGYVGSDSFTYTVSDGQATSTYTVTVSVGAANQPPVGADANVVAFEDTPLNGRLPVATDADGDALTYGLGAQAVHGTVTVNRDGTYTYVPTLNYNGTDTFIYTVSDGRSTSTYTVTITVDPVNDPPVGSDTSVSVPEGETITGALPPATDPEGQPIVYGLGTGPRHGTVTINPDGTYTYTPADGYSGSDSFTYTISDGTSVATYTVSITIDPAEPPEEPRPPLEVDPPPPITAEPTDPGQPPSTYDGIPAGSPSPISSIMDDLDGIADLTAQGPIVNVVNSIRSLNGMGYLPEQGAVLYVASQIGDWKESGYIIDELTAGFFKGGSNIHLAREGAESTWFQIDTMVYNDYLYIMPSSQGGVEEASFGVTLADGSPLPDWLKPTRQGLVIGRPPVGLQFIDLRIYGTSSDGVISDTIRIDLHTGAVIDHVSDQRTEYAPTLFSDSLLASMPMDMEDGSFSALARALEQWNEAPHG
ncbi:Ig-like domain-containing protein [Aliirhizobium terrae]|uniref:tandem-95 repeat protein n=1 Tax=Terrirhizobium terrae TaxID=2926709 RepID=UPI0025752EE5|nr:Ig-like domain-containing protein [Rhizobium sp. CC-CFT758]WJH42182.1 Ig-like domain-containing protein [Rhizobium sp. CC-CFT758]